MTPDLLVQLATRGSEEAVFYTVENALPEDTEFVSCRVDVIGPVVEVIVESSHWQGDDLAVLKPPTFTVHYVNPRSIPNG